MHAKVQTELKKGVIKKFFSEIVVFLVKKGSYMTFNTVKIWKIRKTWSMTKKRGNFGHENGKIISKKTSFRNFGPRKMFPSPQTRRRVSATGQSCQQVVN